MTAIRKRCWTSPKGEPRTAWVVDYQDAQGRRRNKQFAMKKDADTFARRATVEVELGVHTVDSESVTVKKAADIWIAAKEAEGKERSTIKQYKEIVRLHIEPFIGGVKLSRLTRPAVAAYRDELLTKRSKAMTKNAMRSLSALISAAQERGLVAQNVAKGISVTISSRDKERPIIPTKEELRGLLAACDDSFRPFVLTAILTGMRSSELRGLGWDAVNLKAGTIEIVRRADQWGTLGAPKSKAGKRTIPIPQALVQELRLWKLRAPHSKQQLVFPGEEGKVQWHNNLLRRRYQPTQIKAGLYEPTGKVDEEGDPEIVARYGFHALRHAAASAWISQGIDLKRLQVWMGHESIKTTLDTYGHLIRDTAKDAELVARAHAELLG